MVKIKTYCALFIEAQLRYLVFKRFICSNIPKYSPMLTVAWAEGTGEYSCRCHGKRVISAPSKPLKLKLAGHIL